MSVEFGIIEGFYGKPWSWDERARTTEFLAERGYGFYLYAPKADPFLRRRWQESHPDDMATEFARLAAHCRTLDVRFGVGLSPYDVFLAFDDSAREALARKLQFIDDTGAEDLAILFDDMRGDVPQLAERQAEIVAFAAERTRATRIIVCPTYYSDDPVLDRVFGHRPDRYLKQLGELLDPAIEVFWTGPEVCSREISPGHLTRVADHLRRPPFLWDNYPVNDGQRMSQYIHVRGFTGRHADARQHISAHGINPALQPTLSCIPALTLIESYMQDGHYDYVAAQRRAAVEVLGPDLGAVLHEDVLVLQDIGLDRLGDKEQYLRQRYGSSNHPGAREIIAWLDGEYRITDEIVQTQ
jgi:hyaluronoglucosaminidase